MTSSKKIFAVLSVALPLMLVVSMARAEGTCPNVDEQINKCKSAGKNYELFWDSNQCRQAKCTEASTSSAGTTTTCPNLDVQRAACSQQGMMATKSFNEQTKCWAITCSASSTSTSTGNGPPTFTCPNMDEMIRKCGDHGFTTMMYRDCKIAKCNDDQKPPVTTTTTASVSCKRTIDNNKCKVYTCDDGTVDRVCGHSEDKPKPPMGTMPPMMRSSCGELEKMIADTKAALATNTTDTGLQAKLDGLTKKLAACQKDQGEHGTAMPTSTLLCTTKVDGACKIVICGNTIRSKTCASSSSSVSGS